MPLIFGGDFNAVPNPHIDKSSVPSNTDIRTSKTLTVMLKGARLFDAWRLMHPGERDYTFYSNPHKSYSRIDAFWTNRKILSNTWGTKIHNNMHSDHAPISISFSHSKCYARSSNWKFNNSLLLNPSFIEHVKVNTKAFFEINTESVNSFSMIWEAYKATCRGWVISYATQEKKQRMKRIEELTVALNITEQQTEANPKSKEIYLNLVKTQTELGDLLNKKLEFALFKLKSINYDTGDKAGKLLAHHLQKRTTSRQTPEIASHNKDILTDSDLINKRLKEYFSELYRSEYNPSVCSPNSLDIFFKKVNLPKLSLEDRGYLEADITMLEVANAIKSLNSPRRRWILCKFLQSFYRGCPR